MQGIPFDTQSLMGPGLGALWAGQDKGLDQASKQAQTQNLLEQLARSQQTGRQEAQLHPLRMQQQMDENSLFPLKKQELEGKVGAAQAKLDREQTAAFVDDYLRFGTGTFEDQPLLMGLTEKYKIPPNHPIVPMMQQAFAKEGKKGVERLKDAIASGGMKEREQRTREQALQDRMLKQEEERTRREMLKQEEMTRRALQLARERNAAASAKGKAAMKAKNFEQALVFWTEAANAAKESNDMQAYQEAVTQLASAQENANIAAQQKAQRIMPLEIPGMQPTPVPQFGPGGGASGLPKDPLNLGL